VSRYWNYRIVRYDDDDCVGLHEVYYDEGEPDAMTANAAGFVGDNRWSIVWQMLRAMWSALRRPAIPYVEDEPRYTITAKGREMLEGKR
jgi:hypothetical protein